MITPLLSVGELFSHAWKQFTARIGTFIKFGLCAFLVLLAGAFAIFLSMAGTAVVNFIISVTGAQPSALTISLAQAARAGSSIVGVVALIALIILWLVIMVSYLRIALNEPSVTVRQLLREGAGRTFPVLGAAILAEIIHAIGFVLFVIPGIIAYVFLLFTLLAAAQGSGPIQALKKSYGLVKGHWWQVLGRLICGSLVMMTYFAVLFGSVIVSTNVLQVSVGLGVFMMIVSFLALFVGFVFSGPWMLMYMRELMKDLERVHGAHD